MPSSSVSGDTADKIIGRRVSKDSTVYTDGFASYSGLSAAGYRHETVNHSAGEYVKGEAHVNGCWEPRLSGQGLAGISQGGV